MRNLGQFNDLFAINQITRAKLLYILAFFGALAVYMPVNAEPAKPSSVTLEVLRATAKASKGFTDEFDAAVWMVAMDKRLSRYVKDKDTRHQILTLAHKEASRHNLDPQIVLAVMHVESLFDQFAISSAGAQGIMQIMPFWKKELNEPETNLFQLEPNIRFGCLILKTYLEIEKGNMFRALARYNGSLGRAKYPNRVFSSLERFWSF